MARGSRTAGVRRSEVLTSLVVTSSCPGSQHSTPPALSLKSQGRAVGLILQSSDHLSGRLRTFEHCMPQTESPWGLGLGEPRRQLTSL